MLKRPINCKKDCIGGNVLNYKDMKNQTLEEKHTYRNIVAMQTHSSRAMKGHFKLFSVVFQIRSQSLVEHFVL